MTSLGRRTSILAFIAGATASFLVAAQITGCGGSETSNTSGGDGSADAAPDTSQVTETEGGAETGPSNEAASPTSDASNDSSPPTGDAAEDSATDSATEPSDGSKDSAVEPDSSSDGQAGSGSDAQADVVTTDVIATETDASDATTAVGDAQTEGGTAEADAGDATVSSGTDGSAGDSAVTGSDATTDAPAETGPACTETIPSQTNFISDLANVVCSHLQTCCGLTANQFSETNCLGLYANPTYGAWMLTGYQAPYIAGGLLSYSQSSSCQCVEGVSALNCGVIPASTWDSVEQNCREAEQGTVAIGGTCASSYECVSTAYCSVSDTSDPTDAALGTCIALVAPGGACTADDQCSYITTGSPSAYCLANVCTATLAVGTACSRNTECSTNYCGYSASTGFACSSGVLFSNPLGSGGLCDYLTVPDSGAL